MLLSVFEEKYYLFHCEFKILALTNEKKKSKPHRDWNLEHFIGSVSGWFSGLNPRNILKKPRWFAGWNPLCIFFFSLLQKRTPYFCCDSVFKCIIQNVLTIHLRQRGRCRVFTYLQVTINVSEWYYAYTVFTLFLMRIWFFFLCITTNNLTSSYFNYPIISI